MYAVYLPQAMRFVHKIKWSIRYLLPNLMPHASDADRLYEERRDRKLNSALRLPEDEELDRRAVWGVELFGPSDVDSLYEHLTRLKWTAGYGRSMEEGASNWVRYQREYGGAGSYYNVGIVIARGDRPRFGMVDNYAEIPDGVDHLHVRIFQITPSLTSVVIGFAFAEDAQLVYAKQLNQDRRTFCERSERGRAISIVDPWHQRNRSIKKARDKTRAIPQKWFAKHLPGFFSRLADASLPTAELISTRSSDLQSAAKDRNLSFSSDWRRLISSASPYDIWTHNECPTLRFAARNDGWAREPAHLLVSMRTVDVSADALKIRGGPSTYAYVAYCHDQINGILSNYASVEFLNEVSKDLKTSRSALAIGGVGRRRIVETLEEIQAFFDRSLGTPAIVAELSDRAKHVHHYKHECAEFTAPGWGHDEAAREFAFVLRDRTRFLSKKITNEEHSLRENFEQLSTVLSVRESVRAQKRMELLTALALFFAAASLFAVLPPLEIWPDALSTFFQRLVITFS